MEKLRPKQSRNNWFQKQALNFSRELVRYGVKSLSLKGKASEELSRQGGWEVLMGTIAYKDAGEIWDSYSDADRLKIYGSHAVVYACVSKIISAIQEAPLTLGRETDDGFEYADDDEDDILELITKKPNSLMNYRQWVGVISAQLLLTGESFIWEWRDKAGFLTELWPIPKNWIQHIKDKEGNLDHYTIQQGRKRVPVKLQDMTRIYIPDPANPLAALGPLQAALKDYQTDVARENYIAEMLTNLKVPGLILKQPEGWDVEQKKEARAAIADIIGKGKRGNSLFLSGENASVELMAPLKDLDWPGLSSLSETRVCAAFGVPPQTVGLRAGESAKTYSNYEEANRSFYNQTIVSAWLNLQSSFTKGFIQDEVHEDDEDKDKYKDLEFRFDLSGILQLQEDQKVVTDRVVKQWTGSLITRNEARLAIGMDPLEPEIGDVLIVPMNLIEVPVSADAEDAMEDEIDEVEEDIEHLPVEEEPEETE